MLEKYPLKLPQSAQYSLRTGAYAPVQFREFERTAMLPLNSRRDIGTI
jgi:hypothetical protein